MTSLSRAGSVLVASAVVACASVRLADAGECRPQRLAPKVVTPDGATIPTGGGLLIVETTEDQPVSTATGPVSSWRFVEGKRRVAPTRRVLAPGLTVFEPIGTRLDNGKRAKIRSFRRGTDAGTPLAAPSVKQVELVQSRQGYRISTWVKVELASPAPAEQLLVVFDKDGKAARSFGTALAGATSVSVYRAGECTTLPDGTQPTTAGDSITLAWVDATGRMSARSAAVTVGGAAGPLGAP